MVDIEAERNCPLICTRDRKPEHGGTMGLQLIYDEEYLWHK
jgi:hypothetical protein